MGNKSKVKKRPAPMVLVIAQYTEETPIGETDKRQQTLFDRLRCGHSLLANRKIDEYLIGKIHRRCPKCTKGRKK